MAKGDGLWEGGQVRETRMRGKTHRLMGILVSFFGLWVLGVLTVYSKKGMTSRNSKSNKT